MNIEYYNTVNQLPLVNDWCVVTKLYKYYIKTDPELIDNINIANYYNNHGFNDWNCGMAKAAKNNNFELVKFFIEKGADGWNWSILNAVSNNHFDLVKFFIEKGANNWNFGMMNAAANNITITTTGGDTIIGGSILVINGNYNSINIYSDGVSGWFVR